MAKFIKVTDISTNVAKIIYLNIDNIIYMNDIPDGTNIITNCSNIYHQGIIIKESINRILELL